MPRLLCGDYKVRSQLQSAAQPFHRLGMLTKALQRRSEVAKSFRIIRPDRQGRAATSHGSIIIAESPIGLGQVGMINRRVRPQGDCLADQFDCAVWCPCW